MSLIKKLAEQVSALLNRVIVLEACISVKDVPPPKKTARKVAVKKKPARKRA